MSPAVRAFVGARLIDGTGAGPVEDATLVVRDGRIEAVGPAGAVEVPADAERVEVGGRTIVPGFINGHGHVGIAQGLQSGPEYYSKENVLRQLRLYARYGATTVLSLGGDQEEAVEVRAAQAEPGLDRARLYFAGDAVTGDTPAEAQAKVDELAAMGVDTIKIQVDDYLGTREKMPPEVYRAIIERAHEHGLPVAAHLFYLEDAKDLLRSGIDFVAHSVRDQEVDQELIDLFLDRGVCYGPTLTREWRQFVYEETPDFFDDPFFRRGADPEVLEQLRDPDFQAGIRDDPTAQRYKDILELAKRNLKTLAVAGVGIVLATDSGPPARFQGYFEHVELELMAEAGLSPMEILVAATGGAADCLGFQGLGTLEPGNWADLVVLGDDPLETIVNTRSLESVWIAGNGVPDAGR